MKNLRNTHLLEAALNVAASGKSLTMIQIARRIVDRPAPGYYVDYDRAIRYIHLYQKNKLPTNLNPRKRRMWMEIFGRVDDIMQRHPYLTLSQALQRVLCRGNATSFFLHPITAARILRPHKSLLK